MSKTIWYISKYFVSPDENNSGGRGWNLMKKFSSKGYQSVVISSENNYRLRFKKPTHNTKVQNLEGIKLIRLNVFKYSKAKSILRVVSWLHFELSLLLLNKTKLPTPSVIIVSSLSLFTILNGILLKKKYKSKLIFEIRDIWPLNLTEEENFNTKNPLIMFLGWIEKWGYENSDIIVGTMPNLGEHVKNILGYAKHVECIPMGVVDNSDLRKTKVVNKYIDKYFNKEYFNIVYAGSIGITNALETFFKAALILKKNEKIRFVVVGDGNLKNFFKKKYDYLPNVIFAPKVYKNQVQTILSFSNIVYLSVFKSKVWDYGQSLNKVIDYMYAGKPILASYSGYPSMINEAKCGFFVPAEDERALANKIEELFLMSDEELYKIGIKGKKWLLKNRDYNKLSNDYLKIMF